MKNERKETKNKKAKKAFFLFYTFGHLKCPKAERIAPDKMPTCRHFNWQKV
jgi:hypothetical protein